MAKTKKEVFKVGGRKLAHFCFCDDGTSYVLIEKRHGDVDRGDNKSMSDAFRSKEASWLIDDRIIREARKREIPVVKIKVKETGDVYQVNTEDFKAKGKRVSTVRSIFYRLNLEDFEFQAGKIVI